MRAADWSLRTRAFALLVGAQLAVAGLLLWNGVRLAENAAAANAEMFRQQVLPRLAEAVAPALFEQDIEELERLLGPWAETEGLVSVRVTDLSGRTLLEVARKSVQGTPAGDPSAAAELLVTLGPMRLGYIHAELSDAPFRALATESWRSGLVLVLGVLALGTGILMFCAHRLAAQLERLGQTAAVVASGAHAERAIDEGPPELRSAAAAFNRMLDALLEAKAGVERERRRLDAILRAIPHGVQETDLDGTITYCNPAAHRLLGYERDGLVGRKVWEFRPEQPEQEQLQAELAEIARTRPEPKPLTVRNLRRDGSIVELQISWTYLEGPQGELRGCVAVLTDVSEQRRAELRLRESEQRFRDFANAASDWLWETDAEHRFVYFSHADDENHPMNPARFLGMRRQDMAVQCDSDVWRAHLDDLHHRRPFKDFRYEVDDRFGRRRTLEVSGLPRFADDGRFLGYRGVARDVTDRVEAERRIRRLAYFDTLTGLANRSAFQQQFARALAEAQRGGSKVALHLFDVDGFKRVNDGYGHQAGDQLLTQVARRLQGLVREGDLVARLAGDEFAVMQVGIHDPAEAMALATRLVERMREPFILDERRIGCSISCGIAIFPDDAHSAEDLMRGADAALYRVKESGRDGCQFFRREMERAQRRRRRIETALRQTLQDRNRPGLELYFQPRVDLATGRMVGAEALLRWEHPELGRVSPAQFVPLAEQCGLVHELGAWTMREACAHLRAWEPVLPSSFRLAVNLSPLHFVRRDVVREVADALRHHGVDAHRLELEITETALMQDTERTIGQLDRFRDIGISLALDDFGTGYSSLGYLKRFALNTIKIDRSFVGGLELTPENAAIVRAIITLARSLELEVVAEGVETEEQRRFLIAEGCLEAQGFLFAAPVPAAEFEARWLLAGGDGAGAGAGRPDRHGAAAALPARVQID